MAQFLMLLHGDPANWTNLSPEKMREAIMKYRAWGEDLTRKGALLNSSKLVDNAGRVMRTANGKPRVLDGPFSESKEVVGGFYLIEAPDYDAVVQMAQNHPQFEYGGLVEIRQLEKGPA
jgi:hypothetical protein